MRRLLFALSLFAPLSLPALAQDATAPDTTTGTPLDAAGFDAYVTGKTLTYAQYGSIFGTEEYLPEQKVRWRFSEDICQYGRWYQKADQICFVYEDNPDEHCWQFWQGAGGLSARSMNDMPGAELSEVQQTSDGLHCPGPDVGV